MQESTTCSIPFPVTSHHMVDAGPRNPNPSSNIPYTSSIPNMNGMIPQVNGHRMNNRRFSTGSHLSTLFESNNEHTLNTANISNNCSDMSAESSTGNVIGGMVGVRNNSFNSSGPRYSLEMLIAALDTPTEVKHENQSPQEAGFAATYGNGHLRQEIQPQSEHWAPLSTTFGTSADNVWRPWNPSGEYLANPEPEFTQRMEYGMSFQGTLGYNGNANFARAPTFCGQSSSAGSLENNDNRGSAYIKQEDAMTLEALKGFEMVNLNWMQQSQLGEQLMPDNVTRLDASVIQSPPESAFYSQRPNSAQALQNQMRQQQLCQYGNTQSIYGHQTPPTTKLHTPPPPGGMQPYVHAPQSVKFGLSRKRSVPNNESHLALDINNGSGTLSAAEEDMMMRKRSKSFDIAMILSNQGGIPSRSSGQFLETSAFRDQATQASPRYLGQLAYKIESLRAPHGRAITTSLITESNHGMGADSSSSLDYHGNVHTPHPMFDPQTLAIAAHMKNPPPAQCGENIPSVPDLVEETDDDESCPRRQRARYPGDLYTPQWVRYVGQSKQGFCETCSPGKWLQLKNSAYWYHKQFFHGISSVSGKTFLNPLDQRVVEQDVVEGLCHQCNQWIPISNSKRRNCVLWYRHAHKCHIYHKPKNAVGMQKQS